MTFCNSRAVFRDNLVQAFCQRLYIFTGLCNFAPVRQTTFLDKSTSIKSRLRYRLNCLILTRSRDGNANFFMGKYRENSYFITKLQPCESINHGRSRDFLIDLML